MGQLINLRDNCKSFQPVRDRWQMEMTRLRLFIFYFLAALCGGLLILYTQSLLMERRAEDKELTTTPGADEHSGSDVVMWCEERNIISADMNYFDLLPSVDWHGDSLQLTFCLLWRELICRLSAPLSPDGSRGETPHLCEISLNTRLGQATWSHSHRRWNVLDINLSTSNTSQSWQY